MDVSAWPRGLGLQQYGAVFRENASAGEVLPGLAPRAAD
jgi:hypothetical protein